MKTTTHAAIRCQQRGVPTLVIDLLLQFGSREHDHHGAEVIYFDRRARKHIENYTGGLIGKLNEHMNSYAVMVDGNIITVGKRLKRINHN